MPVDRWFRRILVVGSAWIGVSVVPAARADWTLAPESRQHLYQTYANFVDQQNMLAWRGSNLFWATVGANLPVVGNNDSPFHPQAILHVSGNDAMHVKEGGGVFTETLDTRIGADLQFAVPDFWDLRFSVGIQHVSGHTVDGTDDPRLGPLDLGDNTFRLQAFRDFNQKFRTGLLLMPVINSIPDRYPTLLMAQGEYFPLGASEDSRRPVPYVASSLQHRLNLGAGHFTFQLQGGVALGSHFLDHHTHSMRFAIGYYSGTDPRAKYAQYDFLRVSYGYAALIFDL